ncbi:unnamed protein product [Chrysoparadoxa australica]
MQGIWGLIALCLCAAGDAFYIPYLAPNGYKTGQQVPLKVVSLTSTRTQLPYDFYSVPYCRPRKHKRQSENLGEVLTGDVITTSPYEIKAMENKLCEVLCERDLSAKDMKTFRRLIDGEYRVHMMIDNLPAAQAGSGKGFTPRGSFVGFAGPLGDPNVAPKHYLYNHIRFVVKYSEDESAYEGVRVVGFEVEPFSIKHTWEKVPNGDTMGVLATCNEFTPAVTEMATLQSVEEPGKVIFTYDVKWEWSSLEWSNRWDVYLRGNPDDEIHYFSIVNSLMIVLFLSGVVGMILLRTIHKDISEYNEQRLEDAQEESGWKLVHGDVFRPPQFAPILLTSLVGTGVQVFCMAVATLTLAFFGFLSPANRGGMLTALLVLYVLMGAAGGYWSANLYKQFGGKQWKKNTLLTAFAFPSVVFAIFWALNVLMWTQGSSTAVPVTTFISLLLLWFGVSVPLVFAGSYFGYKAEVFEIPTRVNQIARQIPEQQWYTNVYLSILGGGILPFGAVCIELFFIMSALWLHQIYYVFGFLLAVFIILLATSAEITMVMCYFHLCKEDYRWWWRSFLASGSSAFYMFLYSIWYVYFSSKLDITSPSGMCVYFGYMLLISLTFFLLTGCIGFFACFWFVRKIYSAIKVD